MYLSFEGYLFQIKKGFQGKRYVQDSQYRAVLFRQYSGGFRWYCNQHQLANDYDSIAYEVAMFEKRLEGYRTR